MAPLRVAIATESFLPEVNGVTNSVLRVLEHLDRAGHEALVIAPGPGADAYRGTRVVRVPSVRLPPVRSLPIGLPTRKVFTAIRDFRPDVVHLASPFVVGAAALTAARRLRLPTVAVFQTDLVGFARAYGLGVLTRYGWHRIRRLHRRADRTLAPSVSAVESLLDQGVPRVHRWARGVDTVQFDPARRSETLRRELAPSGELLVGYVGRLAPEKQVESLAALNDLPGVRLAVVGAGPSERRLRALLPRAAFLGFRSGDDLAATYASLDVFVHTGPFETFCQAVQEALASGVPVVAPDAGGPRDLVTPGRTGYLYPVDSVDGLRAAVLALADDDRRRRFGAAARRSVLHRTWPVLCDELLAHYAAVLRHEAVMVPGPRVSTRT
ncbi:glycosyltransferase family 4 protein [Kitasatospora sp. NPDC048296]|uniref:glycosyltransferase family 4 protein n=1 Tax=Kitasatospora sp. NPDC048296 TaxID=3364048 RepID=UPI003721F078